MIAYFTAEKGEMIRREGGSNSCTFIHIQLAIQVLNSYSYKVALELSSVYVESLDKVEKQGDFIKKLDRKHQSLLKKRCLPKLDSGSAIYLLGTKSLDKFKVGKTTDVNNIVRQSLRFEDQTLVLFLVFIPSSNLNLVEESLLCGLSRFKSTSNHEQVEGISPKDIFLRLKLILSGLEVEGRCTSLESLELLNSGILNDSLSKYDLEGSMISESLSSNLE